MGEKKNLKEKYKAHDAWRRIQSSLSVDVSLDELQRKKDTLMKTFRKVVTKVRKSKAEGGDDLYKPEWFAYKKMASFLYNVYKPMRPFEDLGDSEDNSVEFVDDPPPKNTSNPSKGEPTVSTMKDSEHHGTNNSSNASKRPAVPSNSSGTSPVPTKRRAEGTVQDRTPYQHQPTHHTGRPPMQHAGHPPIQHAGYPPMHHTGLPPMHHTGHAPMQHTGHPSMPYTGHPSMRHPVNTNNIPNMANQNPQYYQEIEKRMEEAYQYLRQVTSKPMPRQDDCDLFVQLLLIKLRALDEDTREEAMHEIDNVMFNLKRSKKAANNNIVQQQYAPQQQTYYYQDGDYQEVTVEDFPSPSYESAGTSTISQPSPPTP